jgi:hypothetical protein
VKVLGVASAASVSNFIGVATPYFIGASIILMAAWLFWMARRVNFKMRTLAPVLVRHGALMGVIYGVVLLASISLAGLTGVSM